MVTISKQKELTEPEESSHENNDLSKTKEESQETTTAPVNPMNNIFSMENKARFSKSPEAEKLLEEALTKTTSKEKEKPKPTIDKHKDDSCTIFVGNLPSIIHYRFSCIVEVIQKPNSLKKQFSSFGTIKTMRFRSLALKSSRIDHFDKKLLKKVSFIKGNINEDSKTTNAYIVFENEESVEKALSMNNSVFDNYMRIIFRSF